MFKLYSRLFIRWWQNVDSTTFMMLVAILIFGGVAAMSGSVAVAHKYDVSVYYFAKRQIIYLLAAFVIIVGCSCINPRGIKVLGFLLFIIGMCLLPLTLILGHDVKGANRWVNIGGFSLQPTELLKPAMVIVTASFLSASNFESRFKGFIISLAIMAVMGGLILLQPDFSMFGMLAMVWFIQVFLSGVAFNVLVSLAGLGVGVVSGAYLLLPHVRSRVERFLNPESGDSYQVDQAREALLSGGFFGVGAGEGVVKSYLPDAHTDFIFAVIGEEYGLIVCLILLMLFAAIVFRSFAKILVKEDRFVQLAGCGLLCLFGLQVLVNIGVVLNVLPTTGMTLPFISYGGTSALSMALTVGFILSLTRERRKYDK